MDSNSFFSYAHNRILGSVVLVCVILALASFAKMTYQEAENGPFGMTSINVSGEGEVLAKPDIGNFSFSVRAKGEDAATAQETSAKSINDILAYLDESEVEEKDIKNQNYSLNPNYRYEERVCAAGSFCPPGERVIDGYEVSQTVTVKVRDLDKAGDLISGVGDRGATNISSLQFTIDDQSVLEAEARSKAIADAKDKAEQLADDLGMKLGRIVGFNEGGYGGGDFYETKMMSASMDSVESAPRTAPSLPTGENTIRSNVDIVFELK